MKRIILPIALLILGGIAGLLAGLILAGNFAARMPKSGVLTASTASAKNFVTAVAAVKKKRKILYYWDPMVGPSSISHKPGIGSMGMPLIPVYASGTVTSTPGEVHVDPAMVQNMGVQTAKVTLGALVHVVRTVGLVRTAAPLRYDITMRTGGWIGKLYATTNGATIRKGQKLFTLYSPRIVAAEDELVAAQKAVSRIRKTAHPTAIRPALQLRHSVELRLRYLGVDRAQINQVEKTLHALTYVTFHSPVNGQLIDVQARQKSRINAGATVMRIEKLAMLWLDTYVYENQLPWIHMGQRVTATLPAFPGRTFEGAVVFIDPYENPQTHTTIVRIVLKNATGKLRAGMYALADIHTPPVAHALLAPNRAIIHTGTGELAFVEISRGHFDPVRVSTGLRGDHGLVQVLSGLKPGQKVVTSGQFLIDVESQMTEVTARFMNKTPAATNPAAAKPSFARPAQLPPGMKLK